MVLNFQLNFQAETPIYLYDALSPAFLNFVTQSNSNILTNNVSNKKEIDKLYFQTERTITTFKNALEPERAELIATTEDDDEFAEAFRHVFDGLGLSSSGRSDQRAARQVVGSLSQCDVAPARTAYYKTL